MVSPVSELRKIVGWRTGGMGDHEAEVATAGGAKRDRCSHVKTSTARHRFETRRGPAARAHLSGIASSRTRSSCASASGGSAHSSRSGGAPAGPRRRTGKRPGGHRSQRSAAGRERVPSGQWAQKRDPGSGAWEGGRGEEGLGAKWHNSPGGDAAGRMQGSAPRGPGDTGSTGRRRLSWSCHRLAPPSPAGGGARSPPSSGRRAGGLGRRSQGGKADTPRRASASRLRPQQRAERSCAWSEGMESEGEGCRPHRADSSLCLFCVFFSPLDRHVTRAASAEAEASSSLSSTESTA